jgi:hypothetical protein
MEDELGLDGHPIFLFWKYITVLNCGLLAGISTFAYVAYEVARSDNIFDLSMSLRSSVIFPLCSTIFTSCVLFGLLKMAVWCFTGAISIREYGRIWFLYGRVVHTWALETCYADVLDYPMSDFGNRATLYVALCLRSRLHKFQRIRYHATVADRCRLFAAHVILISASGFLINEVLSQSPPFLCCVPAVRHLSVIIWVIGDMAANLLGAYAKGDSHWDGVHRAKVAVCIAHLASIALRITVGMSCFSAQWYRCGLVLLQDILTDIIAFLKELVFWRGRKRKDLVYTQDWVQPTEEDIDRENICLICRSEITDVKTAGKLKCGHCFHRDCLISWLRVKDRCPYCDEVAT